MRGGLTWTAGATIHTACSDVVCMGALWIARENGSATTGQRLLYSVDGGTTWRIHPVAIPAINGLGGVTVQPRGLYVRPQLRSNGQQLAALNMSDFRFGAVAGLGQVITGVCG